VTEIKRGPLPQAEYFFNTLPLHEDYQRNGLLLHSFALYLALSASRGGARERASDRPTESERGAAGVFIRYAVKRERTKIKE
jgi:hypothetical protein